MRRSLLSCFLLLTSFFTLAACGGDATGPSGASVAGTYQLQTVNGSRLPAVLLQTGSDRLEVTSGSMTLSSNQSYQLQIGFRATEGGTTSDDTYTEAGTYTANNNAISFTGPDGESYSGSISGDVLTFTDGGFVFVFEK